MYVTKIFVNIPKIVISLLYKNPEDYFWQYDFLAVTIARKFSKNNLNIFFKPLSANPTKWPNTLKQFIGKLPTNGLSMFGHFLNLALKGLRSTLNNLNSIVTTEICCTVDDKTVAVPLHSSTSQIYNYNFL